ncbi:MAG TPA: ABC transporter ATP-binding protein, partial [Ardenticatenaceae bacterium]|nr:ABC transporter ATP-binding protein [Ardenticatenaceae bacterium]
MSGYAVECTGLAKSFGDVRAVDNLSLAVRPGEVVAVLGPSGCGKTTALRLIAGFERPDAGEVRIGERVVAGRDTCLPPERRRVGLVFQNYALFPHMSVAENVAYGVRRGQDRAARVREILSRVELDGLDARLPHELSGGQQQRVALARALAPQPEVLLMDEPFSNLDAGLRAQVRKEVREILRVTNTAVLFVTHDQEEALLMGDRVAILHAGAVEQVGAPADVFHTPATRFVAGFLGVADFI